MNERPTPTPGGGVTALVAAHTTDVDRMCRSVTALLPPGDADGRAELADAIAQYRACYEQFTERILLLMPTP